MARSKRGSNVLIFLLLQQQKNIYIYLFLPAIPYCTRGFFSRKQQIYIQRITKKRKKEFIGQLILESKRLINTVIHIYIVFLVEDEILKIKENCIS